MSAFLQLARLRVLYVLRSRTSAALFLVLPVVLQVAVGLMFLDGHPFERRRVALVAPGGAPELEAVLARFPELVIERDASEAAARGRLDSRMASAMLLAQGEPPRLVVSRRERLFGQGLAAELPAGTQVELTEVPRFGYVHYLFPGVLTFSILISGLFGMGYSMVRFRQSLFLKKLATTPLRRSTFVAAQVAARALLVLLQVALLVVAARVVFQLPLSPVAVLWVAVASLLGVFTFMGAGFALAVAIENDALMNDLINVLIVPLVFLSEIFFPVEELPGPLAALAVTLPSTQLVRVLREVLLHGVEHPGPLLPGLAVLLGWALLTYAIGVRAFRWHR